jgi:DNA-binding SARP family transcriptional activator
VSSPSDPIPPPRQPERVGEAVSLPPQTARLVRQIRERVRREPRPLVQLWGWPGSGGEAVLAALAEALRDEGPDALPPQTGQPQTGLPKTGPPKTPPPRTVHRLTAPLLAGSAALPAGAGWWIADGECAASTDLTTLAGRLAPSQHAVVLCRQRLPAPVELLHRIGPEELLLRPAEVAAAWSAASGEAADRAEAAGQEAWIAALLRATDGWWEPLRRLLAELAEAPADERWQRLGHPLGHPLELPAVRAFIESEVLARLPEETLRMLRDVSVVGVLPAALWREVWRQAAPQRARWPAALREWIELDGLVVTAQGPPRLPSLVRELLREQQAGETSPAARRRQARRVALAAHSLGDCAVAAEALLAAGDAERLRRLVELDWLELWAVAPVALLRRLAAALGAEPAVAPGAALELLRSSLRAIDGDRAGALAGLEGLAARQRSQPRLAAVAALVLEELDPARPAPSVAARSGRGRLDPLGRLSGPAAAALAALRQRRSGERAVELAESAAAALPAESSVRRLLALPRTELRSAAREGGAAGRRPESTAPASGASAQPGFEVRLFGVPSVVRLADGEPPAGEAPAVEVRWSLRRCLLIFVFLASAPDGRATREEIVEAAWSSEREVTIRRNFHPTLSHLRRSLRAAADDPAALEYVNGVYQLSPRSRWWIDLVEYQHRLEEGRRCAEAEQPERAVIAWEAAWRLYRGPFLEGFYEQWVEDRRERLAASYLDMLRRLGGLLLALGNPERAIDAFRGVLAVDPLQEGTHVAIMRILARQERRDLVRRQYDQLTRLLRDELLVEPMEETTAEYNVLMGS